MAWPPPLPPTTRTNATLAVDVHAADHNQLANALGVLIAKGTLVSPWRTDVAVGPGSTGVNVAYWTRIGPRVFVDTHLLISGTGIVAGGGGVTLRHTLPFAPATAPATGSLPRGGPVQSILATPSLTPYFMYVSTTPTDQTAGGAAFNGIIGTGWFTANGSHLIAGAYLLGSFAYNTDAAP